MKIDIGRKYDGCFMFSFYLKLGKYRVSTKHVRLIVVEKKSFSQKFDKCSELMRTSVILPLY
jgi:hypothetical protein